MIKVSTMKKIPPALKWLADKRARIAGEIESCAQVKAALISNVDVLRLRLASKELFLEAANRKAVRLTEDLAAADRMIVAYDPAITPSEIEAVHEWRGSYGKRGRLRDFLTETFRSRSPEYLSTPEIALLVITHFSMVFECDDSRRNWYQCSLRGALKNMVDKGILERDKDREPRTGDPMGWRWKEQKAPTLAQLQQMH